MWSWSGMQAVGEGVSQHELLLSWRGAIKQNGDVSRYEQISVSMSFTMLFLRRDASQPASSDERYRHGNNIVLVVFWLDGRAGDAPVDAEIRAFLASPREIQSRIGDSQTGSQNRRCLARAFSGAREGQGRLLARRKSNRFRGGNKCSRVLRMKLQARSTK